MALGVGVGEADGLGVTLVTGLDVGVGDTVGAGDVGTMGVGVGVGLGAAWTPNKAY